ncbi:MAG: sigma-54 dependent transcriptional regulator [Nitrospirota bacterium]
MNNPAKILIVDDERVALKNLEYIMKKEGYEVVGTQSGSNAIRYLDEQQFDVVLTDMRMEKVDGMQVLKKCRERQPDTEVIMITGYATLEAAVETMKHGAFSYIAKPFKLDEVRKAVSEAVSRVEMKKGIKRLKERAEDFPGEGGIISRDRAMQKPLDTARQVALVESNVLIIGEKGTGKELFARSIHAKSKRFEHPFVAVHCGSFTEEKLADELFGHEKGMSPDGPAAKKGAIEEAAGGTLFLGEITAMHLPVQAKLLRVLEAKEIQRIGGTRSVKTDVRIIAAAEQEPLEAPGQAPFRQDLYYRLNVVSLHLPPLSGRKADIPLLSYYFLKKYADALKKPVQEIAEEVIGLLTEYGFPGNVRELESIIERGIALANGDTIELAHLPEHLKELSLKTFRKVEGKIPSLEEQEMTYIKWVLNEAGGNKTLAAQILGIDRVSLWRKLKKYGLEEE